MILREGQPCYLFTPPGHFDVFAGRSESLDDSGGDIVMVLGEAEVELKVIFSEKYGGRCLHCQSFS